MHTRGHAAHFSLHPGCAKVLSGLFDWARSLVRLALAGALYYLRPREAHWNPAGNF